MSETWEEFFAEEFGSIEPVKPRKWRAVDHHVAQVVPDVLGKASPQTIDIDGPLLPAECRDPQEDA